MNAKSTDQALDIDSEGSLRLPKVRRRRPTKRAAPVLTLVPNIPCMDTVECLRDLLGQALRGEIVGLAFAAQYRGGRKYCVEAAGQAFLNPTFAAGMAASLRDLLARRARGEE